MSGLTWNEIPDNLQARVSAGDQTVLGPLAAWLIDHPPRRISEDLRQKVLVTLCRLMNSERGRSLLKGARSVPDLLASIAARHRNDERRADQKLRQFVESSLQAKPPARTGVDPLAIVAQSEVRKAILAGFARLAPLEREALVRALVFGQTYRHIARSLFGSDGSVRDEQRLRMLVFRARKKLQARLGNLHLP
jgi:DNA-directed RNA polymerase specialized sigma24 family protein